MINFNRIFRRETGATDCQPKQEEADGKGGNFGYNAATIYSDKAALSIAAYYRALEVRARTMSQLVVEYQRKSSEGRNYTVDNYGINGRLNYILQVRPNPLMSAPTLLMNAEIKRLQKGNGYIYIERGSNGLPVAQWICEDATPNMDGTYNIQYRNLYGLATVCGVPYGDLIHLRNAFSDDGVTGVPTWKYASQVLSIAATNDKLVLDTAAKGGRMKLIVQEQGDNRLSFGKANPKQMEKITKKLGSDLYREDVVFLNNIAGVTPFSLNLQQQEVSVMRNFSVREIARLFGVPPIILMDDSNSSYKSPEAATQEFMLRTIQPNILELEGEYNSKLLLPEDFGKRRIHVCERNLLRLDPKQSAEVDKLRLETGVKTVNELRAENDQPRVDNGDDIYVSTNLAVAGSDKLKGWTSNSADDAKKTAKEGGEQ